MAKTAFISYASEDEAVAHTICSYLQRNGVSCWIAPRDVRPGEDYGSEIIDGIESSAVLVLVLSEHANASRFVKREVERAVSKGKPVFPVRVREVTPSKSLELFISSTEWIDAWQPPIEQYLERLAESIRSAAALYPAGRTGHSDAAAADRPAHDAPSPVGAASARPARRSPLFALAGLIAVIAIAGGLGALLLRERQPGPPPASSVGRPDTNPPPRATAPPAAAPAPTTAAATTAAKAANAAGSAAAPPAANAAAGATSPPAAIVAAPKAADAAPAGTPAGDPCPRSIAINRQLPMPFSCQCSAQSTIEGTVWGSDVYTDDSTLCRAALHAGVVSPQGGPITVMRSNGRPLYIGSTRGGVRSNDYGAYPHSIEFKGAAPPPPGPGRCPASMSINRELPTPFTCRCTAQALLGGAVWGTDVYTADSSLCRAALHAGRIAPDGGTITVVWDDGRPLYIGSSRNGVASNDYGAYPASIRFR